MHRRTFLLASVASLMLPRLGHANGIKAILYKDPHCSCCTGYADYLWAEGFDVTVKITDDLAKVSADAGVPAELQGCHSTFLGGYVVDGHVPAEAIRKLLAERPPIAGITLPGMPEGSPGMGGTKTEPFMIYAVSRDAEPTLFVTL
jgi:hypothetical protein